MSPSSKTRRMALLGLLVAIVALALALLPNAVEAGRSSLAFAADATVRLEPSSQNAEVGQTVPVSVLIDNVSGLLGVELRLRFDPTRLQVRDADVNRAGVQISPGYFPDPSQGFGIENSADNSQGTVDYAAVLLPPPVSGSGTVATVSFVVTAPGGSYLRLETCTPQNQRCVKLANNLGQSIPFTSQDAEIVVGGTPPPSWTAVPSPSPTPTATATPTGSPSATATATSTATPTATLYPTATATPTAVGPTPTVVPTPAPRVPPPGFEVRSSWYFAEGSTKPPFDTWLLLQNPGGDHARVRILFMKGDGTISEQLTQLAPTSRRSFFVNEIVPDSDVSMLVQADSLLLAERAMYFRDDGHASVGIASPARRWYLAEGSAQPPFQTWILLQNPGNLPAAVTARYMLPDGNVRTQQMAVAPYSRASIYANLVLPQVAFSAQIDSDQPVVVERAMYMESGGGHGTPGVTEASRVWYLAEGSTEEGIDTWILLQNPGADVARATLTAMLPDGKTAQFSYLLPPTSRTSIYANLILPPTQFGARIEADKPVIVERALYFGSPTRGAHASVASPVAANAWYLPEGSTAEPFREYLLLLNPSDRPVVARVNFMKESGFGVTKEFPMLPTSRLTIDANHEVPNAAVSAKVTAEGPIVVERSMYFAEGQGGTNTVGIPGG